MCETKRSSRLRDLIMGPSLSRLFVCLSTGNDHLMPYLVESDGPWDY